MHSPAQLKARCKTIQPQPLLLPSTTPLVAWGAATSQEHSELGLCWECTQMAPIWETAC